MGEWRYSSTSLHWTRWIWVVSFTSKPLLIWGQTPEPTRQKVGRAPEPCWLPQSSKHLMYMPEIEILRTRHKEKTEIFCSRQDDNGTNGMDQIPWAEVNESGHDTTPGPPDYAPNCPSVFCIWKCGSGATASCYWQQEQRHSLFCPVDHRSRPTSEWTLQLSGCFFFFACRMSWFRISCRRPSWLKLSVLFLSLSKEKKKKKNSMVWVRERTIPTERPPLLGEVVANFCG
jgi:hypothetical protein